VVAVNVGIILAALLFMGKMSKSFVAEKQLPQTSQAALIQNKNTLSFTMSGPLFFGAVNEFEKVFEHIHDQATEVIFNMRYVPYVDASGLMILQDVIARLRQRKVKVSFVEIKPEIFDQLAKAGIT
jgi:SulP family sulfate permease